MPTLIDRWRDTTIERIGPTSVKVRARALNAPAPWIGPRGVDGLTALCASFNGRIEVSVAFTLAGIPADSRLVGVATSEDLVAALLRVRGGIGP